MLTLKLAKHYMWIFTSRIFRLALETTFFIEQVFFLQRVYELLSQKCKRIKRGGPNKSRGIGKRFLKKINVATFIRDPRVVVYMSYE